MNSVTSSTSVANGPSFQGETFHFASQRRRWHSSLQIDGRYRTTVMALFFCTALSLIEGLQHAIIPAGWKVVPNSAPGFWWEVCAGFGYWLVLAALVPVIRMLSCRFPLEESTRWRDVGIHLVAAILFAPAFLCGGALLQLITGHTLLPFGPFLVRLLRGYFSIGFIIYWGALASALAVGNSKRAKAKEETAALLQVNLVQAQLTAMRSRLNPHFLFNALNSVCGLAATQENDAIVEVIGRISNLLRRCLDEDHRQETTLQDELMFVEDYLEIQQVRFSDRLGVCSDIDPSLLLAQVPSMLLQPLIENAVQYGVSIAEGPAAIAIKARAIGRMLIIEITDTGPGFDADEELQPRGFGIGISAAKRRIELLYGAAAQISCSRCSSGGAKVTITLPLRLGAAG